MSRGHTSRVTSPRHRPTAERTHHMQRAADSWALAGQALGVAGVEKQEGLGGEDFMSPTEEFVLYLE